MANTIASILRESSLGHQIIRFLMENENAMDTAKGIAAWWLGCDEMAAQAALDQLTACGVITVHTMSSGFTYYGLTQDQDIRTLLWTTLAHERGNGGRITPERNILDGFRPLR
jgi:hypothetical protein